MRVCLLTPEFLPEWGGVGTYTYNLARGLSGRAEVHVVTARSDNSWKDYQGLDGVSVHSLCSSNGGSQPVSPFRFQLAAFRRLPDLVRNHDLEIVHANHAYMSDLFARLRPTQAATVLTVHTTLDTQIDGTQSAGPGVPREQTEAKVTGLRVALKPIEKQYLRKTPNMIFVSQWVRDRLIAQYGARPVLSEVIPNAVDATLFSPNGAGGRVDPPTILFAGRLLALKGVATLLRAMLDLNPDIRLLLAGPGDPGPWREYARRIGLANNRCVFLGRIAYGDMPALCRKVSALVLPSFSESCPMTALEAMASGTPLIASASGGTPEIVRNGETGWLVPPGDAGALAQCIDSVLADRVGRKAVVARARAWIEMNASVERMADRTIRFYERALSAGLAS